jgi:hypothetical protein
MRFHAGAMSVGTRGLLLVMLTGFVALVVANLQKRRYTQQSSDQDDFDGLDVDAAPSWKELYKEAQRLDISGRSRMSKDQLEAAVRRLG